MIEGDVKENDVSVIGPKIREVLSIERGFSEIYNEIGLFSRK